MPARRQRIATLLPLEMEYSGRLLAGAIDYVREHPHLQLVDLPYSMDTPARLRLPSPLPFEAAFLWATQEASWVETLIEAGLPLISASGDWPVERVPCVSFDSKAFVARGVDHLASLQPAILVDLHFRITGIPPLEGRKKLFEEVAAQRGMAARSAELFRPGDGEDDAVTLHSPLSSVRAKRLARLLKRLPKPAAIWCGSDHLARRVCEVAAEAELRIPEDVAVLGTGNFQVAQCGDPALSTLPLPGEMIGHRAMIELDRRLTGRDDAPNYIPIIPPPVLARRSTTGGGSHPTLSQALDLIAARACEGLTVRDVAGAMAISPQALHARMVQKTGRTPGQEIRRVRVETAKRHLQDQRLTIARVAGLCGFNQQSKFADFFRRETGLSPRDWRKANG